MTPPSLLNIFQKFILSFSFILISGTILAQQADFTADITTGCFPLTVKFTDNSTGTITGYTWDFGNSNSSSLQNPSAIFSAPGTYTIKLTVFNGASSTTKTKNGYIVVRANPVADFAFDKVSGCAPLAVTFTDKSLPGSGTIAQWFWVFGDGGTRSDANPQHNYLIPGSKTISLKVRNQYGCEHTVAKASAIQVMGPKVTFTADNTTFCQVPATVNFSNTTTGDAPLTYTWKFGDGKTSTEKNPSTTYTQAGNYMPVLTVRDVNGCVGDESLKINAGSEGGLEVKPSTSKLCIGQALSFTVTTDVPVVSYEWNFGNNTSATIATPSVAYTKAGNYVITLRAQLLGKSCQSVVTIPIQVIGNSVPSFTYTVDCNNKVTFTNTSTKTSRVVWTLNNGVTSSENKFGYDYPGPGDYTLMLTAYNELECSTVLNTTIHVSGKPVAYFTPIKEQDCLEESLSGCAPFTVQFKNLSQSEGTFTSKWIFGDGSTATSVSPRHTYTTVGIFDVSLEIKNNIGCVSTIASKVTVSNKTPVAKFSISKNSVCSKEAVTFTDLSTNATFWCWDFGDGTQATGQYVTHSYTLPGTYTVKLVAKNGGCTSTFQITNAVKVNDPFVDFKIINDCVDPHTIQLSNLSTNYNTLLWDFGDGTSSTTSTSHHYNTPGNYTVNLTARNNTSQCTVTTTASVSIYDLKADLEVDNPKPCKDATVTFTDKSTSAVQWQWDFGNGKSDSDQNTSTTYNQAGTYTAILRAYDGNNCMATKTVLIEVLDINGNFDFTATSTCEALTVQFTDKSSASPAVQNWLWDFGDNQTSALTSPSHVYSTPGTYPIKLTLTNGDGTCSFIRYDAVKFTIPTPDFMTSTTGNCIRVPIQFINQSLNSTAYSWNFGNGNAATDIHPVIFYDTTGNYTITLKATDQFGCEKEVTKPQYISITKPTADFDAFGTFTKCPPLTTIFTDKSVGNLASWTWNLGDGQNSSLASPACTYLKPGEFDVSLLVTDMNGCTDTKIAQKIISIGGPYGNFEADGRAQFCLYDSTSFIAHSTNAINHRWDFGDGNVVEHEENYASHIYEKSGPYQVALILIDENGCEVLADGSTQITVQDTTTIDFFYPSCIFTNEGSSFKANPQHDNMTYTWLVDQQIAGTDANLPVTLSTAGNHTIILKVINEYGCPSTLIRDLPVQGDISRIPNIFTPNGDDYNKHFEVEGLDRSTWDLFIYNRWGRPVFDDKEYTNAWDGGDLSTGVYFYVLQNAICPDKNHKGTVTIAR